MAEQVRVTAARFAAGIDGPVGSVGAFEEEAAAAAAAAAARLVDNRTRSVAHAIGGAYGLNRLGVERLIRSKCMHTVSEERSRGCARLV